MCFFDRSITAHAENDRGSEVWTALRGSRYSIKFDGARIKHDSLRIHSGTENFDDTIDGGNAARGETRCRGRAYAVATIRLR